MHAESAEHCEFQLHLIRYRKTLQIRPRGCNETAAQGDLMVDEGGSPAAAASAPWGQLSTSQCGDPAMPPATRTGERSGSWRPERRLPWCVMRGLREAQATARGYVRLCSGLMSFAREMRADELSKIVPGNRTAINLTVP